MAEKNTVQATDIAVAKHLFERIARMGKFDLPGVSVWQQLLGEFSGDLIMSAPRPSGGINILLGDFNGRGLAAAVSALPVAEVFYGMTEKGFGLSDIIEEINKKLLFILPDGLYCSACLIELEQEGKMLAVWNGGLPDLLVVDKNSQIKHRVPSAHIPLGIKDAEKADLDTAFVEVEAGDKVFCSSDGILNAINQNNNAFGQQQVEQCLQHGSSLANLSASVSAHSMYTTQYDDMTVLELDITAMQAYDAKQLNIGNLVSLPAAHWQAEFEFSAQVLKQVDLVPLLINMLMQIQAPHEHKQRIYTVLAEMFSNALEHGLLELESSMKQSANGFSDYYALRGQRLAELEDAHIKISMHHQPYPQGGKLTLCVEDSGEGFDYQQRQRNLAENMDQLCGRGEGLLRQLCSEYYFSGKGNIAHAEYIWTT
mgnify:CR=1 FL=1